MPSNPSAVLAAHQLVMHAESYKMPLPSSLDPNRTPGVEGENKPQVIVDPEQGQQMMLKLLEQRLCVLSDLWKSSEQRASDSERAQTQAVDFAPRYFTTASRDLHRAVAWCTELKKEKL
jgi:hypothetical protein